MSKKRSSEMSKKRSSVRKSKDPKQRGKLAENYVIMNKLGRGNFAVVRMVQRKLDGKYFAAKIITKKTMNAKEAKMMAEEVEILKKLRHPNINRLIETFNTKHHLYIVLELLQGDNLFDNIVSRRYYTEADAANVVKQVARACEYMHPRGVIHRDLKPENLVYLDKEKKQICVTDFGLSKYVGKEGGLTETACGTPAFVAPEVLRQENYGSQVDMWSLGVILYTMLCGYPPFVERNLPALYKAIRSGKIKFDKRYWSRVSESAKDCVRGLLTVDYKKRLTPEGLLNHKWLTVEAKSAINLFEADGYDKRFKRYVILTKLQKGVDTILFLNKIKRVVTMVQPKVCSSEISLKGVDDIEKDLARELEENNAEGNDAQLSIY